LTESTTATVTKIATTTATSATAPTMSTASYNDLCIEFATGEEYYSSGYFWYRILDQCGTILDEIPQKKHGRNPIQKSCHSRLAASVVVGSTNENAWFGNINIFNQTINKAIR